MKLIIDIPDHVYEHAKNMSEDSNDEYEAMRAIAKGEKERPHGEWIFDKDYPMIGSPYGSYKCSKCGMHTDDDLDNYCLFCGARMKGGDENEQT